MALPSNADLILAVEIRALELHVRLLRSEGTVSTLDEHREQLIARGANALHADTQMDERILRLEERTFRLEERISRIRGRLLRKIQMSMAERISLSEAKVSRLEARLTRVEDMVLRSEEPLAERPIPRNQNQTPAQTAGPVVLRSEERQVERALPRNQNQTAAQTADATRLPPRPPTQTNGPTTRLRTGPQRLNQTANTNGPGPQSPTQTNSTTRLRTGTRRPRRPPPRIP